MNTLTTENSSEISNQKEKKEKLQLPFLINKISISTSLLLSKPNLSNNSTTESIKNNDNDIGTKEIFAVNKINKENNNNNITLLGKKTKIFFNTTKQKEKKPTFFTTKYSNSKKEDKKKIIKKNNLFQTQKYFYLDDSKKETNAGRWTYEEHIKFIESFVKYGKKWANIQKYIGTRSCGQIRSHAQKFFHRLKALKSDKCFYDFKKNNIQSLLDIINLIAKNNKTNKDSKEFIINTLIELTSLNLENNGKKYFEKKKDNFRVQIIKEKGSNNKISEIQDESLNKRNNNNKEIKIDDSISDTDIIKDKDDIQNKNLKEKKIEANNDKIIFDQKKNSNYKYIDFPIIPNIKINSFLFSNNSNFYSLDNATLKPMIIFLKKNNKSSFSNS